MNQSAAPTVSVVIPTYNRLKFIDSAIASVLKQTYTDYELIVVDDGSTDGTADFITHHYPEVNLICLPQSGGASRARNQGIQASRGQFVAFLDSDDQWLPEFLAAHVHALQADPHLTFSFCDYIEVNQWNATRQVISNKPWLDCPNWIYHLLLENFIPTMSIVTIRRTYLEQTPGFNEKLTFGEDKELFLRLMALGRAVHLPQPLVSKIAHSGSLTANFERWAEGSPKFLDYFFNSDVGQPYRHFATEARCYNTYKVFRRAWTSYRKTVALRFLRQAFWISPRYTTQYLLSDLGASKRKTS